MPTKHVSQPTWDKVEKQTYQAVVTTGKIVKDTEMLNYLILKGIENMTEADYQKMTAKRRSSSS